jgi:hypothetical protein
MECSLRVKIMKLIRNKDFWMMDFWIKDYRLQIADYKLQITNWRLQIADRRLQSTITWL